jgi:hypothetical protein
MSTTRPFAYNPSLTPIGGTTQVGTLAIGYGPLDYSTMPGGVEWWNGPDEDLGYVIASSVPSDGQDTPIPGNNASVGFDRTNSFDDGEFIRLTNNILNSNYTAATDASVALTTNGYWNSYVTLTSPVLSLDAGNPSSYPGTGTVWTDLIGGKVFNLINGPGYDPANGGKFYFFAPGGQYAECSTSLSTLSTWTVGVWHFFDGTNIGTSPCIVTEVFPGTNNTINYIIGNGTDSSPSLQTGFFTGGWNVNSAGYVLTTGWHYIVGTYDGTSIKLYVDNTLIDTQNTTIPSLSSNGGIRLMRRWDLGDYWGGYLATVDIYNAALSNSEITSRWNLTKSRFGL